MMRQGFEYPTFMDIEASGLGPDSYPISIAFNDRSGAIQEYRIAPVYSWKHWDWEAERLHKITRESLFSTGVWASRVANVLERTLAGQTVYVNSLDYGKFWLCRLFAVINTKVPFSVTNVQSLIPFSDDYDDLRKQAWASVPYNQHTASADVYYTMQLFNLALIKQSEEHYMREIIARRKKS